MTAQPETAREQHYSHSDSIYVEASPAQVWDLVTDIKRTGEWSPICKECWWKEPATGVEEGAWFHGRNEANGKTWETQSLVVAAQKPKEFTWMVAGKAVRWSYTLAPEGSGTRLTESWSIPEDGFPLLEKFFGENMESELAVRRDAALSGIPETLAAIKRVAEAG